MEELLSTSSLTSSPAMVHRLPSKVSCLAWSPYLDGVVTVGDYDGVLSQLHICSGHLLGEVDDHLGRRILGVAHSKHRPFVCASVSDDKYCKVWGGKDLSSSIAQLRPSQASVCGVDFSLQDENQLALASSDHNIYIYDIRHTRQYMQVLTHHRSPVSYVKYFGGNQLASASTDGSIALWKLEGTAAHPDAQTDTDTEGASSSSNVSSSTNQQSSGHSMESYGALCMDTRHGSHPKSVQPWRVMQGHRNEKHFCGLTVRSEDGLFACGSESPEVFTYHLCWSTPLASHAISNSATTDAFVSAVSWQPASASKMLGLPPVLAAGTSHGDISLFALLVPEDS